MAHVATVGKLGCLRRKAIVASCHTPVGADAMYMSDRSTHRVPRRAISLELDSAQGHSGETRAQHKHNIPYGKVVSELVLHHKQA